MLVSLSYKLKRCLQTFPNILLTQKTYYCHLLIFLLLLFVQNYGNVSIYFIAASKTLPPFSLPCLSPQQMDDAVYTFEQILHQSLEAQGTEELCKTIQRCQDRVIKVKHTHLQASI